jgi:hypothetical protein
MTAAGIVAAPAISESAPARERCDISAVYGRLVGYVTVQGRWAQHVPLPIAPGDRLTQAQISDALQALRKAITAEPAYGYSRRSAGEIGALYIDVECEDPAQADIERGAAQPIGLIFRPFYVRLSLQRIGDNVLPIPRTALPTFYENVPAPLLALNPAFSASHDRKFGTAIGAALQTDLLALGKPGPAGRHLDVQLRAIKSVQEAFYRSSAGLRYGERRLGGALQEYYARVDVEDTKEPLGSAQQTRVAGGAGIGVTVKVAPTARLSFDTGYRHTSDTVRETASFPETRTTINEQTNRVLFDALPPPVYGFLRAAIWEDNGSVSGPASGYQRLAARIGYAKEIAFQPNYALGFEMIAGAGKAWGSLPESARFFGGNAPGSFLYDQPSGATLLNTPSGPLVRSFGENQAGFRRRDGSIRGGDAYWHVNLNLAIPIRKWSRALIPDEETDLPDEEGRSLTLKQFLKRQIDVSGASFLQAALRNEGLSEDEAKRKAESVLAEIRPASHFIIDDANLYSVKPLLMLDAAGLSDGNGAHQTWLAAGIGFQFTIVTAKFEGGYMRTLSGPTFGNRGNLFFRIVFQNLF